MKSIRGFSIIEALIVVVAFVLVGLVGYNLYSMQQAQQASTAEQQAIAEDDTPAAPEITSAADLDEAVQVLDSVDPSQLGEDFSALDSEAAF